MAWSSSVPVGTDNLPTNRTAFQNNFTWIETDVIGKDHFFDESNANLNGHHKFVSMPDNAGDVTLPTDTDGAVYVNDVDGVKELIYRNSAGIQPLSYATIRAFAVFDIAVGVPTILSSKNSTVTGTQVGSSCSLTFTFDVGDQPPDTNYMIYSNITDQGAKPQMIATSSLTTANFKFCFFRDNNKSQTPLTAKASIMVVY